MTTTASEKPGNVKMVNQGVNINRLRFICNISSIHLHRVTDHSLLSVVGGEMLIRKPFDSWFSSIKNSVQLIHWKDPIQKNTEKRYSVNVGSERV